MVWWSTFDFTPPWLHCIALYVNECDKLFCVHVYPSSVWWSAFDSTLTRQCGTWVCCIVFDIMYSSVYMYVDGLSAIRLYTAQQRNDQRLISHRCGDTVRMHKHMGARVYAYRWFHVTMAALTLALIKWKLRCVWWHKSKSMTRWFRVIMVDWGLFECMFEFHLTYRN